MAEVQRQYLGLCPVGDIHHVDGVLALVFALLFVLLLEYPLFADTEATGEDQDDRHKGDGNYGP